MKKIIKFIIKSTIIILIDWIIIIMLYEFGNIKIVTSQMFEYLVSILIFVIDYIIYKLFRYSNEIKTRMAFFISNILIDILFAYLGSDMVKSGSDDVFGIFFICFLIINAQILLFIIGILKSIFSSIKAKKNY